MTIIKYSEPRPRRPRRRWRNLLRRLPAYSVAFVVGLLVAVVTLTPGQTEPAHVAQAAIVQEDSPAWDCRTMGNHLCGPGNSNGVVPGFYQDGKLYADWDHAQWMAYGLAQQASQAQPVKLAAHTSTPGDSPDNPAVLQPIPGSGGGATEPQTDLQPQTEQPQPETKHAQPQARAESQAQSVDVSQLLQSAKGGDVSQLQDLLSQLDPETVRELLPLARQACQAIQ